MTYSRPLLITRVAAWPASTTACRPTRSWSGHPVLSMFADPGRAAEAAVGDPAVFAALTARDDDDLATSAALSAVAGLLLPVAWRWARCGLRGEELRDAEADLVVEALAAMRRHPDQPAGVIAQTAWHRVAARRRRERSRARRLVPLASGHATYVSDLQTAVGAIGLIADAFASGALTTAAAAALCATGMGWSIREGAAAAGCSPTAWRSRQSRARRALRAALQLGEVA